LLPSKDATRRLAVTEPIPPADKARNKNGMI
jgi:hypothetical protein